jgi:DUF4097 and DUF4098 domain-containing protein YvlB
MTHSSRNVLITLFVAAVLTTMGLGQATTANGVDRVTVPLTDPARPVTLRANLLTGSITVKAHNANNVIVEARVRRESDDEDDDKKAGRKRILITTTGLTVEEENNVVRATADTIHRAVDLTIYTPVNTSVNLKAVNDGNIVVSGLNGELDVDCVNGEVTLDNVSGNAIAHALNGDLKVTFRAINNKPMAFSSLNGDIEVSFPPDLKANVSITSDRGDVYSDFDIAMQQNAPRQVVENGRDKGGKFRVRIDKTVRGTIAGGGQEIQFKNFQGGIYIKRAGTAPTSK